MVFDGMESWLPWLAQEEQLLPDLLPPEAQLLLLDPRRIRDRISELLDEEEALASTLAQTWGAVSGDGGQADGSHPGGFPRLHLPFDRILARAEAPVWSMVSAPEGPSMPAIGATGWDPVMGDASKLATRLRGLASAGYRVVLCADGEGSAARLCTVLADEGVSVSRAGEKGLADPGLWVVVQPLERGFVLPSSRLAVLAEADVTGRRRPHRPARPRARATEGFFDDLEPGDYVVHHHHGVARYGGMVRRSLGGSERDYLLLEYRGGDKLYVPSDQIDAITPYTGGETPALSRMGGADFQRTKSKVRAAVREVAQELVVLYRRRITTPGPPFSPDSPWQVELEHSFPYTETPEQAQG